MRLPRWSFLSRFRLRIMFQNVANYLILFVGIFFIMIMLAMAVGMPDTLDYYKSNTDGMMFAKYQYVLKSYEDDDNKLITTENKDAEKFDMTSLVKKSDALDEEISVYGIADNSNYVKIKKLSSLKKMKFIFPLRLLISMDLPLAIPYRWMKSMKTNLTSLKLRDFMTNLKVLRSLCRLTITEKYLT